MLRVCFIGNSHLAALKLGWDSIRTEYPTIEITFFGAMRPHLQRLTVRNGTIIGRTAEVRQMFERTAGRDRIGPDYDLYVMCGMQLSAEFAAEGCRERTTACAMASGLEAAVCMHVQGLIRALSDRTIAALPQPMPAGVSDHLKPIHERGEEEEFATVFHRAVAELAAKRRFDYVPQPERTLESPLRTKKMYAEDSPRLRNMARKRPEGDIMHMNASYGVECLRDFFAHF